jgi:Protein of unknown function (DUF760)
MSNLSHRDFDNFESTVNENSFWQYVNSLHPQTVKQLTKPGSEDVVKTINLTVATILGNLSADIASSQIVTSRDELGMLLGSVMIDGYFLRNAEQRMELEQIFQELGMGGEKE